MFKSMSNCISIMVLSLIVFGCSYLIKTSQMEDYQEFVYDFDNNSTGGWYGPATINIVNGQLHLSSRQGYIWRNISNIYDTSFIEGNLDLDIYLSEGSYLSIETKGQLKIVLVMTGECFPYLARIHYSM